MNPVIASAPSESRQASHAKEKPLLMHRSDSGENPDIALVPIAKEAVRGQLFVTKSLSAKVADSHAGTNGRTHRQN